PSWPLSCTRTVRGPCPVVPSPPPGLPPSSVPLPPNRRRWLRISAPMACASCAPIPIACSWTWPEPPASSKPPSARPWSPTASGPSAPPAGLLTPALLRAAYDITPIYSETFSTTSGLSQTAAITGAGQTVALYELSPYDPADIAAYDAAFGLSATLPLSVPVDGGATDAFGGTGAGEAALDIELVQAVAPGAQILVYSGPA